ncbi:hypothetical protein TorRG33x02_256020 [Trema orientale]|uniref:Uncharacterized protein n=1 Tax=Trema orientale TaxID=63057 RepID=A0A2P5DBI9_TREOI|nr:hypothetical protein TorRG33x02_256020 [Trema orientale]
MKFLASQVEHNSLEDLSFSLKVDESVANEAIIKTLVGRFLAKKPVSNSLLRAVMGKVWRPKVGWKMQEVAPGYFIFRFTRRAKKSADMNTMPIWVQD